MHCLLFSLSNSDGTTIQYDSWGIRTDGFTCFLRQGLKHGQFPDSRLLLRMSWQKTPITWPDLCLEPRTFRSPAYILANRLTQSISFIYNILIPRFSQYNALTQRHLLAVCSMFYSNRSSIPRGTFRYWIAIDTKTSALPYFLNFYLI